MDAAAIVGFVAVGVLQHGAAVTLVGLLRTAVPLLAAWFLIALLVGTYRRVGWVTAVVTWLVAVPLGLLARSVVRGGPWGEALVTFGAVAMAFTLLFVLGGRVLLLLGELARSRSGTVAS